MYKVRKYIIAIVVMMATSMTLLLLISTLAYLLKWQSDKALIGIIVTYILAGFAGGFAFKRLEKRQFENESKKGIGKKAVEALLVSNIFMLILLVASFFVLQNSFAVSGRFLMIWGLLMSSTFLGRIIG